MFSTPIPTRAGAASVASVNETVGGNMRISCSSGTDATSRSVKKDRVEEGPWCIFQLPAITAIRGSWEQRVRYRKAHASSVRERIDPREAFPRKELERGAAARRDVGDPVRYVCLLRG